MGQHESVIERHGFKIFAKERRDPFRLPGEITPTEFKAIHREIERAHAQDGRMSRFDRTVDWCSACACVKARCSCAIQEQTAADELRHMAELKALRLKGIGPKARAALEWAMRELEEDCEVCGAPPWEECDCSEGTEINLRMSDEDVRELRMSVDHARACPRHRPCDCAKYGCPSCDLHDGKPITSEAERKGWLTPRIEQKLAGFGAEVTQDNFRRFAKMPFPQPFVILDRPAAVSGYNQILNALKLESSAIDLNGNKRTK